MRLVRIPAQSQGDIVGGDMLALYQRIMDQGPEQSGDPERTDAIVRFGQRWVRPMDPDMVRSLLSHGFLKRLDPAGEIPSDLAHIAAGPLPEHEDS